jgi:hypothetical protein
MVHTWALGGETFWRIEDLPDVTHQFVAGEGLLKKTHSKVPTRRAERLRRPDRLKCKAPSSPVCPQQAVQQEHDR